MAIIPAVYKGVWFCLLAKSGYYPYLLNICCNTFYLFRVYTRFSLFVCVLMIRVFSHGSLVLPFTWFRWFVFCWGVCPFCIDLQPFYMLDIIFNLLHLLEIFALRLLRFWTLWRCLCGPDSPLVCCHSCQIFSFMLLSGMPCCGRLA